MNFIQRLFQTKKVKKVKEKISSIDEKLKVTEKVSSLEKTINSTKTNIENKIENILDEKISFNTFLKTELKLGKIIKAEKIKDSNKLLKLLVDFGNEDKRQIISGISQSYTPEEITGQKAIFVTNLEPRKIFGLESNGMIVGVKDKKGNFSILIPQKDSEIGQRIS